MPPSSQIALQPRKSPVQQRSAASVDAILEATVQVLMAVGKEQLTTTRVAARAGVSVGTLYQYFPNKSSLLQAALRRHLEDVTEATLRVCREQRGEPLATIGEALASAFLTAKMKDGRSSVALYAVASDVDGEEIARQVRSETHIALCDLLLSASDAPRGNLALQVSMLQGMMSGVSRQLLESTSPEKSFEPFRRELVRMVCAYLQGCARLG